MAPETSSQRESEEHSIKARKHEMFEEEAPAAPTEPKKPLKVYLRDTPATPLTSFSKVALWVVGLLVVLLFAAALLTRGSPPRRPTRTGALGPAPSVPVAILSRSL